MSVNVVFETHSWSTDNDIGTATGWNHGRLSERGRKLAAELGDRRRDDGVALVFTSDLARALETAQIAFAGTGIPILSDWRLRECNYGSQNGMSAKQLHRERTNFLFQPYPDGESWEMALERVGWFLDDVLRRHDSDRILVIGHVATRWGLQHYVDGTPLAELEATDFAWGHGWEYVVHKRLTPRGTE